MLCWPSGYARTFDCLKGAGCGFDIPRRHHFLTFLMVEQQHKWPSPATAPAGARLQKQKKSVPSLMNCFYRFSFYRFPFHQMKPRLQFFLSFIAFHFPFSFSIFFFFLVWWIAFIKTRFFSSNRWTFFEICWPSFQIDELYSNRQYFLEKPQTFFNFDELF